MTLPATRSIPAALRRTLPLLVVAGALAAAPAVEAPGGAPPCTGPMAGGDWARYGQDLRGAQWQAAEDELGVDTVGQLERVWTLEDTGYQSPPPIVSGGCVFLNTGGRIVAYDLRTGEVEWESSGVDTSGTFAVTVVDGRVHVGLANDGAPQAAAFKVTDGSLLWISDEVSFGYETGQQASAVVHDGIQVLFTVGPDFDPEARQGYALIDAATGEILHEQTTIPEDELDDGYAGGGAWGTPSVDPQTDNLYVGTSNPESKTREHAYDNAIIKIDLDRDRPTFGQVVGSYKGTPDSVTGYDNRSARTSVTPPGSTPASTGRRPRAASSTSTSGSARPCGGTPRAACWAPSRRSRARSTCSTPRRWNRCGNDSSG